MLWLEPGQVGAGVGIVDPMVFPGSHDQVALPQELGQGPDRQAGEHFQAVGTRIQDTFA